MVAANRAISQTACGQRTLVWIVDESQHAGMALPAPRSVGFSPGRVSVVATEGVRTRRMVEHADTGGKGTAASGLIGWLTGISALAIPGIGSIVRVGALSDRGVPDEEARGYEERIRGGRHPPRRRGHRRPRDAGGVPHLRAARGASGGAYIPGT